MSAPAGNGATDEVAIEVDGDDSLRAVLCKLMRQFIPNFILIVLLPGADIDRHP